MTTFSVIIPVYNVAPYLRECLDSIAAQTFANWECICVDDGSSDGSETILDEYAEKDGRFKIVHQKNAGVSAARNTALEMAAGEYFFFVDGDDAIVPDSLECFNTAFDKSGADGLLCHPDEGFLEIENWKKSESDFEILSVSERPIDLLTGRFASHGYVVSRIYRRLVFGKLRFQTGVHVSEDVRFWVDALCVKAHWAVIHKRYYAYRRRIDSASAVPSWSLYRDCLDSMSYVFTTMRNTMGATSVEVERYAAKFRDGHHYIFARAFGFIPEWGEYIQKDFFRTASSVCMAARPAFPFYVADRIRLLGHRSRARAYIWRLASFVERIERRIHRSIAYMGN